MTKLAKLTDLGFETADILVRPARGKPGEEGYVEPQFLRVRGFSTDDLMSLVKLHGSSLALIYEHAVINNKGQEFDSMASFIKLAYEHAPEALSDVIAIASDAEGEDYLAAVAIARKMPVALQFEILETVMTLTFPGEDSVGEFIETVVRMLGGIDGLMKSVKASVSGSKVSGSKRPS